VKLENQLLELARAEALPDSYVPMALHWFVPVAEWLQRQHAEHGGALLVGVNGAQGTGKTTFCKALSPMLAERGIHALTLGLDDFYLDRSRRGELAGTVHPLLQTRGVPGTHDLDLLNTTLDTLLAGESASVPVFDKAIDDRLPPSRWLEAEPADVILLEGWCIGVSAESADALAAPINRLETEEDANAGWRRFVNAQLSGPYAGLFGRLDKLVVLQAPSLASVLEWRRLQESKLAQHQAGSGVMSPEAIERFVQHYERLTRHGLSSLPAQADYLLEIAPDHRVIGARER